MKQFITKKKILIIGGSSFFALNWALQNNKNPEQNIVLGLHKKKISIKNVSTIKLHYQNTKKLSNQLFRLRPEIIVLAAAITSVEKCEKNKKLAKQVNYILVKNICKIAKILKAKLIFISTDQVFSGKNSFYTEKSKTKPLNYYAKTKLMSENYIKKNLKRFIIIRTNFFGWGPKFRRSLSDVIIDTAHKGKIFYGYHDIFFSPILVNDLIDILIEMINKNLNGIFNVAGSEQISKYEFALRLHRIFNLNQCTLKKKSYFEIKNALKRPANMTLSTKKIEKFINFDTYSIQKSLMHLKLNKKRILSKILYL